MSRWLAIVTVLVGLVGLSSSTAPACTFCGPGNPQTAATLRQDVGLAKLVLYGTLTNARLNGTGGTTDLNIERVLKNDPFLAGKKTVTLSRYIPADPKDPPKFLVLCDVVNGKLDAYRGVAVKSPALVDYLKGAMDLDAKDRATALLYFFRYLDHTDLAIANDAYLEFAKATDQEVGQVARRLDPAKLRKLIQDAQTPANRIGLFAFLLGACGTDADAAFLNNLVKNPTARTAHALDGALGGYIHLRPREGWQLTEDILRDSKRPFSQRCAAIGTVRFYHQWKGKDTERDVLRAMSVLLDQGDIADMAIEDLRQWKLWDLTPSVLAQYGKKSHDAPIMRRAIVRYALCCPRADAVRFVGERRKQEAELVKDVEETLQFDKK